VLKKILGVKNTTPSWCLVRGCGLEPLQFNWLHAALRLYNPLTQCNSSTMRKVLQADMQLSSKSPECWSWHILSAMEGLIQFYMFKQKLLNCEPFDLSRFVVNLRDRYLEFWTPFSDSPRERSSKTLTYHQWCALPAQRAMVLFHLHREMHRALSLLPRRTQQLRETGGTGEH
jgi:hypothetical protein